MTFKMLFKNMERCPRNAIWIANQDAVEQLMRIEGTR